MSIYQLVTNFTTSCWIPLSKSVVSILKSGDKNIPNILVFLNAKKFNNANKIIASDKERYDALVNELISLVKLDESLQLYTINFNSYITELELTLKSNKVYGLLCVNFLKGSYGKMMDDFNRVIFPKTTDEDDDSEDPTDSMKQYVKNYSYDFDKVLSLEESNGIKFYKSVHDFIGGQDAGTELICNEMLSSNTNVFSIYSEQSDQIIGLWGFLDDALLLVKDNYQPISANDFMNILSSSSQVFSLNPEHSTNLDTIKRNYMNKQSLLFLSHVKLLSNTSGLYFYRGEYKHSCDFNNYSELQFSNAVASFPISFEDYTRSTFALFFFDKQESIQTHSFWVTTKKIESILSSYDMDLFEWSDSDPTEFLNAQTVYHNAQVSILH